jgi:hypothetical protein
MYRTLVGLLVGQLLIASFANAADDNATTTITLTSAITASAAEFAPPNVALDINLARRTAAPHRPLGLPSFYAGSAFLQGYDAYSTLTALNHGGAEANPLMKAFTKRPIAFIGLKAGVTVMSIMAAERMWKDDNRLRAVLMMVASNGCMAIVAAHNAAVLKRLQ